MKNVLVIAVNYNNSAYSLKLAESLQAQKDLGAFGLRLLVVDNSVAAHEAQALESGLRRYSWAEVLTSGENLGYFGGLNLGLKHAGHQFEYIVIGNNDLYFDPSFVGTLLAKAYSAEVQVVCPDVVTIDGVHQNPHLVRRTSWLRRLKFDLYFSHYFTGTLMSGLSNRVLKKMRPASVPGKAQAITMGVGACYVLLPSFFQHHESLFFDWFLFGEEACLSWQVRKSGGILWYDPSLVVTHAESATCSKLPSRLAYEMGREAYWGYRELL